MPFTLFAIECAPNVHPDTIAEMIRIESAGDPLALNINGPNGPRSIRADTEPDAIAAAELALNEAVSVDVGLMQINSANFEWLGLTLESAFEPCLNIEAGAKVLTAAYKRALREHPPGQSALQVALSIYNTGDPKRGFHNGYVERYYPGAADAQISQTSASHGWPLVYTARSTVYVSPREDNIMITNTNTTFSISQNTADALLPGAMVEVDPDDPRAFVEDAISEEDAVDANADLAITDEG